MLIAQIVEYLTTNQMVGVRFPHAPPKKSKAHALLYILYINFV